MLRCYNGAVKPLDIRQIFRAYWQPITLFGLLLVFVAALLTYKLGTLLPGFSGSELHTYQGSLSFQHILHNPINAPFSVLGWAIVKTHLSHPLIYLRVISATLALGTVGTFCAILYYWHGKNTALLGTFLFCTSSWFLHTARGATPDVLMFGFFILVACGVWLRATNSPYALIAALLLCGVLLYVPGMASLIVLGLALNWRSLDRIFSRRLWSVTLGAILFLAILAPLGWDLYHTPMLAKTLFGLPTQGWPTPFTLLRNFLEVPVRIFIYGQSNPAAWLDHLAVLSVFETVMFLFGCYAYLHHFGLRRSKLMLLIFMVGSLVIGLGGETSLSLLLPFVYLVVAAGVDYMLGQWFKVFPRNPIAQTVGVVSFLIVVLLGMTYQTRQYFVAWPQNDTTQAVFTHTDPSSIPSATIRR